MAQTVKNPPARWENWVLSLGQENPLEKGMATHSSILAWRIPWTEESDGLQSMGLDTTECLTLSLSLSIMFYHRSPVICSTSLFPACLCLQHLIKLLSVP